MRDDRVTDHRLNENVYGVSRLLSGGQELDALIDVVQAEARYERLTEHLQRQQDTETSWRHLAAAASWRTCQFMIITHSHDCCKNDDQSQWEKPLTSRHQNLPTWLRPVYLPSCTISSRSDFDAKYVN